MTREVTMYKMVFMVHHSKPFDDVVSHAVILRVNTQMYLHAKVSCSIMVMRLTGNAFASMSNPYVEDAVGKDWHTCMKSLKQTMHRNGTNTVFEIRSQPGLNASFYCPSVLVSDLNIYLFFSPYCLTNLMTNHNTQANMTKA